MVKLPGLDLRWSCLQRLNCAGIVLLRCQLRQLNAYLLSLRYFFLTNPHHLLLFVIHELIHSRCQLSLMPPSSHDAECRVSEYSLALYHSVTRRDVRMREDPSATLRHPSLVEQHLSYLISKSPAHTSSRPSCRYLLTWRL